MRNESDGILEMNFEKIWALFDQVFGPRLKKKIETRFSFKRLTYDNRADANIEHEDANQWS